MPQSSLLTPKEYLELEADALDKHECLDGRRFERPPATIDHALIAANVTGEVGQRLLRSRWLAFESSLRVRTPIRQVGERWRGLYAYPSLSVTDGRPQAEQLGRASESLVNPMLVVQVSSPETSARDLGTTFERYAEIESFREYVLIDQAEPLVTTFLRRENGDWKITHHAGLDAVARLDSIGVALPLAEVYAGVQFEDAHA